MIPFKFMKGIPALMLLFILLACEKDEIPVEPFDRGDAEDVQLEMGSNYINQIWYDLGENKVVAQNSKLDWDFAFDCNDGEYWIYLNGSTATMAASTDLTDFDDDIDQSSLAYKPDHSSGIKDSLSLGRWWENEFVWVLDRGYKADGSPRGKRKIKFTLSDDGNTVNITYANMNGNNPKKGSLTKNEMYNTVSYSISEDTEVEIEPVKSSYDLLFTQYINVFYSPYTPYLVTGALINQSQVIVAEVFDTPFENITGEMGLDYDFTDSLDVIGYDWKSYNLDAGAFTVYPEMNYMLRDAEGFLYKFHFVDFYNDEGEKGYPKMEIKRL